MNEWQKHIEEASQEDINRLDSIGGQSLFGECIFELVIFDYLNYFGNIQELPARQIWFNTMLGGLEDVD